MKFWTSIMMAAFILLLSTFILGMSALGVDIFEPHSDVDKDIGVNKLVYYFNNDDQEVEQRKFIIAREIGDGTGSKKEDKNTDSNSLPINGNSADAFEAPPPPQDPLNQSVSQSTQQEDNILEQQKEKDEEKKAEEKKAEEIAEENAKTEAEKQAEKNKETKFTFSIKMTTKYTAQVFDQNNKLIKTFYKDFYLEPGEKTINWDRKDDKGNSVTNGKYLFKVTTVSPGIPVLIYHHLALGGKGYDENPFTETPENFLKQMDFLSDNNYNVISIDELAEFMQGNKMLPPKSVAITFDDGYESVYKYAFPILKKHKFKATAFIIGKKAEGSKANFVPNMGFEQLREMYQSGVFDIQSHTYDLHDAVQISPFGDFGQAITAKMFLKNQGRMETDTEFTNRITQDLTKGKDTLEKNVGTKVVALAWPHGKNHETPTKIAKGMGYKYFIEGSIGPNYIGEPVSSIKRVFVKKDITNDAFSRLLNPKTRQVQVFSTTTEIN